MSLRAALHPPSREYRMFFKRKQCPACGRRFATRASFHRHVYAALVASELDTSMAEGERLYDVYGLDALILHDAEGAPYVSNPEASESG